VEDARQVLGVVCIRQGLAKTKYKLDKLPGME
jgi:hypothetical protein